MSRPSAALALLRGGRDEDDVEAATRELDADVVHVHNMLPAVRPALAGRRPRRGRRGGAPPAQPPSLLRDRRGGARRRPLLPLPSPEHAAGPRAQLPRVRSRGGSSTQPRWRATSRPCSRTSTASWCRASTRASSPRSWACRATGSTCSRTTCPPDAFAERSRAGDGGYALVASRLAPEKGIDTAIRAAALADIPLRVAGEGPVRAELVELANLIGGQRGLHRAPGPGGHGARAGGRRDGPDAVALPRVLAVLGARGDGRRACRSSRRISAACRS